MPYGRLGSPYAGSWYKRKVIGPAYNRIARWSEPQEIGAQ